jgi:hypothetical protein
MSGFKLGHPWPSRSSEHAEDNAEDDDQLIRRGDLGHVRVLLKPSRAPNPQLAGWFPIGVPRKMLALTAAWPGLNIRWQSGTEVDMTPPGLVPQ